MNILLVEDNPSDAMLLTELLAEQTADLQINWLQDGSTALDYIGKKGAHKNATAPQLVLLDLSLPRVSGYDVLKELKTGTDKNIPVIILSTSTNPRDLKECEALGADCFISKPHNLEGYENLAKDLVNSEMPRLVRKRAN